MTPQKQLEQIREACIAANPANAIRRSKCDTCGRVMGSSGIHNRDCAGTPYEFMDAKHDIRLADVLHAVMMLDSENVFADLKKRGLPYSMWQGHQLVWHIAIVLWNLPQDRLEDQSPQCIAFLASLLAPKTL